MLTNVQKERPDQLDGECKVKGEQEKQIKSRRGSCASFDGRAESKMGRSERRSRTFGDCNGDGASPHGRAELVD